MSHLSFSLFLSLSSLSEISWFIRRRHLESAVGVVAFSDGSIPTHSETADEAAEWFVDAKLERGK